MQHVIGNHWEKSGDTGVQLAPILRHEVHPEGLDMMRVRWTGTGAYRPESDRGILATVLKGEVICVSKDRPELLLRAGTHVYLPPSSNAGFRGQSGASMVLALSPSAERAPGEKCIVRDDQFLAACAAPMRPLRWMFTPQYLSRRVFLHHDRCLLSKSMQPVSWFHTTMFDVAGLPHNDEGVSVFKMSYNHRTEPNCCYDVSGTAKVRMALHPYNEAPDKQRWGPWQLIDSETTYHLNEDANCAEFRDHKPLRNKHEIRIENGHVSLMCMHDPAPTGAEMHSAGEYSEYGNLAETLQRPEYAMHLREMAPFDRMVDVLSMAKARGEQDLSTRPEWQLYLAGLQSQRDIEAALYQQYPDRVGIMRPWGQ